MIHPSGPKSDDTVAELCTCLPKVTAWQADRMSDDYSSSRSLVQRLTHHRSFTSRKTILSLLLHVGYMSAIMASHWRVSGCSAPGVVPVIKFTNNDQHDITSILIIKLNLEYSASEQSEQFQTTL